MRINVRTHYSGTLAMMRSRRLKVIDHPGHGMFIGEPCRSLEAMAKGWNHSDYLYSIGQEWLTAVEARVER